MSKFKWYIMRYLTMILFLLFRQASSFAGQGQALGSIDFLVIVNARNPVTNMNRGFLSDVFFKKITHWDDDSAIQPVDLKPDSPVRQKFSDVVLSRSVSGIKSYWQQLIFSGQNVPPPELVSDKEVIQYVMRYPGAIGYISRATNPAGAKVVDIK